MDVTRAAALLVAALSLLVTGCGSDDSDAPPAATAAAPTAAAPAPAPAAPAAVTGPSATVSWQAPMQNEDGTPLLDLAGFRIRHGATYGTYTSEVRVDNPGATSHLVGGLRPGLNYVVVSAIDREGQEGPKSRPQRIMVN